MRISDWSSDVCSSDLGPAEAGPPQYRLLGLVLVLLAQQRNELGGAARSVGGRRCLAVLGQGLGRLGFVLGLDRQLQRTALAIHAGELGLDRVADLEQLAGVLDAFRSGDYTSELKSLMHHSYAGICVYK